MRGRRSADVIVACVKSIHSSRLFGCIRVRILTDRSMDRSVHGSIGPWIDGCIHNRIRVQNIEAPQCAYILLHILFLARSHTVYVES